MAQETTVIKDSGSIDQGMMKGKEFPIEMSVRKCMTEGEIVIDTSTFLREDTKEAVTNANVLEVVPMIGMEEGQVLAHPHLVHCLLPAAMKSTTTEVLVGIVIVTMKTGKEMIEECSLWGTDTATLQTRILLRDDVMDILMDDGW